MIAPARTKSPAPEATSGTPSSQAGDEELPVYLAAAAVQDAEPLSSPSVPAEAPPATEGNRGKASSWSGPSRASVHVRDVPKRLSAPTVPAELAPATEGVAAEVTSRQAPPSPPVETSRPTPPLSRQQSPPSPMVDASRPTPPLSPPLPYESALLQKGLTDVQGSVGELSEGLHGAISQLRAAVAALDARIASTEGDLSGLNQTLAQGQNQTLDKLAKVTDSMALFHGAINSCRGELRETREELDQCKEQIGATVRRVVGTAVESVAKDLASFRQHTNTVVNKLESGNRLAEELARDSHSRLAHLEAQVQGMHGSLCDTSNELILLRRSTGGETNGKSAVDEATAEIPPASGLAAGYGCHTPPPSSQGPAVQALQGGHLLHTNAALAWPSQRPASQRPSSASPGPLPLNHSSARPFSMPRLRPSVGPEMPIGSAPLGTAPLLSSPSGVAPWVMQAMRMSPSSLLPPHQVAPPPLGLGPEQPTACPAPGLGDLAQHLGAAQARAVTPRSPRTQERVPQRPASGAPPPSVGLRSAGPESVPGMA